MYKECRHIKPNGDKCHSAALNGKPYCYFHTRLHLLLVGKRAPSKKKQPLELPLLEDRASIQLALAQILSSLGADCLDPRRAGLLLYGLQIASQNVARVRRLEDYFPVRSLTLTADGEELAPEVDRCDRPDDCLKCRYRNTCPRSAAKDTDPEDDDAEEEDDAS